MLKKLVTITCTLLLSLALGGLLLPNEYTVSRQLEMNNANAEQVFNAVNDLSKWRHWGVWYQRDPNMKATPSGNQQGVGAKISWISVTEGSGEMEIFKSDANSLVQYTLHFPDFDMTSVGTIKIEPKDEKVVVTWSDSGELGMNPINRYFGLMLDGMIGPDFEQGLLNLEKYAATL